MCRDWKLLAAGFCAGWIACSSLAFYALANARIFSSVTKDGQTVDADYKVVF